MKLCSKCNISKDKSKFQKDKRYSDGVVSYCKDCMKLEAEKYNKTKKGVITTMYLRQKRSAKKRGHSIEYSKTELIDFIYNNNFNELYYDWKQSNYNTDLKPSIDRLDENEGYNLNNIRLVTWRENMEASWKQKMNGIGASSKLLKKVIAIRDGVKTNFISIAEASRETGASRSNIAACLRGDRKTTSGYSWESV